MNSIKYFFGKGEYDDVLTCLSTTKVNSYKTSSLPLAQFWRPSKSLDKFISKLKKEQCIDISTFEAYFEYPTECLKENVRLQYSKPSMTDLMLMNKSFQIAIEGKYTEYSESHYETIKEWNRDNEVHKNKIKENWFSYLKDCQATNKTELIEDIPYQFLHRTASACFKCENRIPVLVYQLFYDDENKEKEEQFVKELEKWAGMLGLSEKIKFLVFEVKITNIDIVEKKYKGARSDLFLIMKELKDEPIFEFDWNTIRIRNITSKSNE